MEQTGGRFYFSRNNTIVYIMINLNPSHPLYQEITSCQMNFDQSHRQDKLHVTLFELHLNQDLISASQMDHIEAEFNHFDGNNPLIMSILGLLGNIVFEPVPEFSIMGENIQFITKEFIPHLKRHNLNMGMLASHISMFREDVIKYFFQILNKNINDYPPIYDHDLNCIKFGNLMAIPHYFINPSEWRVHISFLRFEIVDDTIEPVLAQCHINDSNIIDPLPIRQVPLLPFDSITIYLNNRRAGYTFEKILFFN
jgi:hypothetical protein